MNVEDTIMHVLGMDMCDGMFTVTAVPSPDGSTVDITVGLTDFPELYGEGTLRANLTAAEVTTAMRFAMASVHASMMSMVAAALAHATSLTTEEIDASITADPWTPADAYHAYPASETGQYV